MLVCYSPLSAQRNLLINKTSLNYCLYSKNMHIQWVFTVPVAKGQYHLVQQRQQCIEKPHTAGEADEED